MTFPIHETDLKTNAVELLPGQFDPSTNLKTVIQILVGETTNIQEIENTLWTMLTSDWLSNATKAQLDEIGKIVGAWPRTYVNDEDYRQEIYLQIAINTSQGDPERLISITNRITGAEFTHYICHNPGVALLYAHELTSWIRYYKVQGAALGGVRVVTTGSPSDSPFVFGYDLDASGNPYGTELSYGLGFGELIP